MRQNKELERGFASIKIRALARGRELGYGVQRMTQCKLHGVLEFPHGAWRNDAFRL